MFLLAMPALMGLVWLLVYVVVACLLAYVFYTLINYIDPPPPIKKVAVVILVVVFVVALLIILVNNIPAQL